MKHELKFYKAKVDPKARREIKEKEDLLGCLEFLVFQELRDRRA